MQHEFAGEELARILARQGRTKRWLAEQVGVSRQTIQTWCRDGVPPWRMEAVALALDLPHDELAHMEGRTRVTVSRDVHQVLRASGRTWPWLARMMGVSRGQLNARLRRGFTSEEEAQVAGILNVSRDWLFARSNSSGHDVAVAEEG